MKYYVKSFEEDFYLKTVKGDKKINSQSIENIIKTKTIKPNTQSFGKKPRLACSRLHKNYLKTYRSQGLIFQTEEKPDNVYPFDIVLLTNAKKIIIQYYRIKNNLHKYYGNKLIKGHEAFIFKTFENMIKHFPNLEKIWKEVNNFRAKNNLSKLPESKKKLMQYNEVIFHRTITIKPIAIYGYKARAKAKELNLPYYKTAKEFYNKHNKH